MAMVPPTIVVAAAPAVVMPTTAAMTPPMAVAMTAPDMDDSIVAAESIRHCGRQCGRCSSGSKATENSKSNKCKFEPHGFLLWHSGTLRTVGSSM